MIRRPPRSTRTDTLFPCTTLFRSTQVFNVAASYVLWRAGGRLLDLAEVADGISGRYDLADETQRATAWHRLDEPAEHLESAGARQALFSRLCAAHDIHSTTLEADRPDMERGV